MTSPEVEVVVPDVRTVAARLTPGFPSLVHHRCLPNHPRKVAGERPIIGQADSVIPPGKQIPQAGWLRSSFWLVKSRTVRLDLNDSNFAGDSFEPPDTAVAICEQVKITRKAIQTSALQRKQRCSLQMEVARMRRLAEPVRKSLGRVTCEDNFEVVPALFSKIEKAPSHGRAEIPNIPGAHTIDPRQGRRTFATRHTLAHFHNSSIVAGRCLQQSRSASSASSRPILSR